MEQTQPASLAAPRRHAILLVADDKGGLGQRRFYTALIDKADRRSDAHLRKLRG